MYKADFYRMIDDHAGRLPSAERPAFFARLGRESLELDRPADAEIVRRLAAWWLGHSAPIASPLPASNFLTARKSKRHRKPTLASVAKQASKAAIPVARYEVKPDGTVVVVTGQGEQQQGNELDEWIAKHARAPERH